VNAPDRESIAAAVADALRTVEDPCMASAGLDLSILDLGLVQDVRVEGSDVCVELTFTELGCSFTHHLAARVQTAIEALEGVQTVQVRAVWTPRWTRERLSPRARRALAESSGRLSELRTG
jgi:metal-sulfur cluster biosynthetic enzyme